MYLPIEIYSREIHSRLYLANEAAENGWNVVIGPRFELSALMEFLPAGVYLGIGFHTSASKIATKLKKCGHKIISIDEEGMVRLAPKYYREYRVDKKIFDVSDQVVCWSEGHRKEVEPLAKNLENLIILGSPRLDILAPRPRAMFLDATKKIKDKFGDFILINSSFGTANNLNGIDHWRGELKKRGWFDTEDKTKYQNSRIKFQTAIFKSFQELAVELAKDKQRIVIRPHPSECLKAWKKIETRFPDHVHVEREGNVIPWMLASEAIIHNGCTTAIEGRLLDKPIISYRPFKEPLVESELANSVGLQFEKKEDLIKFLGRKLADTTFFWPAPPELNQYEITQSTADRNFTTSFVKLVDEISQMSSTTRKPKIWQSIASIYLCRFKLYLSGIKNKENRAYEEQKCDKIHGGDSIDILNQLKNQSRNKQLLKVSEFTKRSVLILKANGN